MLVGTVFTLFVVPVFYAVIAADHGKRQLADDKIPVLPQRILGANAA
jgi:hypothetical protein